MSTPEASKMAAATELWPPGSKYDVQAIRDSIQQTDGLQRWSEYVRDDSQPESSIDWPEDLDPFDMCLLRKPNWQSVQRTKKYLANGVMLDNARKLLLAFLDKLLTAKVAESDLKIDLNADWEDWNVPPRRLENRVPPHPRVCFKGTAGQRPSIEVEFLPDGHLIWAERYPWSIRYRHHLDDPASLAILFRFLLTRGWPSPPTYEFGDSRLYFGDCRKALDSLSERPIFLFADPPFNIGHSYDGFDDNLTEDEYRQLTHEWIRAAESSLADDGVMAIHVPDDVVPLVLKAVSLPRISWIIWHYRFGQCHRSHWINSKAHCLVFAKNPEQFTWNPDDVLVPSDRATTYKDKRTQNSATPGQRVPFDVWGIPSDGPYWGRVQGNNAERRPGHPNQLPELYLERLIRAYTNPGDLVLDPFVGSGTTVVVAEALGRRSVGIDVSLANIDSAFERVQQGPVRILP